MSEKKQVSDLSYDEQILIKNQFIKVTFTRILEGNDLVPLVDSDSMSEKAIADFVLNLIQYAAVEIKIVPPRIEGITP